MTTREQDHRIEDLCLSLGGSVHVRHGYADEHVEVTAPNGACFLISPDGVARQTRGDFSRIDWKA